MPIETLKGWAVKLLADDQEFTFIMVSEELPAHDDIMATAKAMGHPQIKDVLSVQRSVPLAIHDHGMPERP